MAAKSNLLKNCKICRKIVGYVDEFCDIFFAGYELFNSQKNNRMVLQKFAINFFLAIGFFYVNSSFSSSWQKST